MVCRCLRYLMLRFLLTYRAILRAARPRPSKTTSTPTMKMMVPRTGAGALSPPTQTNPAAVTEPPISAITSPTAAITTSPSIAHLGSCRASCLASFLISLNDAQGISQLYAAKWTVRAKAPFTTLRARGVGTPWCRTIPPSRQRSGSHQPLCPPSPVHLVREPVIPSRSGHSAQRAQSGPLDGIQRGPHRPPLSHCAGAAPRRTGTLLRGTIQGCL